MYEQKYIDCVNESYLEKILNGQIELKNDLKSYNQKTYFAFQHYVIKCYQNNININDCKKYIKIFYNDFKNRPYLYCDSPLLKNITIGNIFKNNEYIRNQILEYRNKYYDYNIMEKLSIKNNSNLITESEKNRYYALLITALKKDKYKDLIIEEIERIIKSDLKKLTDMQLKFYCQYVSNKALSLNGNKHSTTVMIGIDDNNALRGNELNDYIFINKNAIESIELLTKTICHETRHSIQEYSSKDNNNLEAFEKTQHDLFVKYLNTRTYDSYHKNYKYSTIELDAENYGHWAASVFFTMFHLSDLADKVRINRKNKVDNRNDYKFMVDENNCAVSVDKYIVENMDKIIRSNPNEIDNYPVLKNFYNKDGSRKNIQSLFKGKIHETDNYLGSRGLYDNYIKYEIIRDGLDKININSLNLEEKITFVYKLSSLFRGISITTVDYLRDKDASKYNKYQVLNEANYQIKLSNKILTFINKNYDLINNLYISGKLDTNNPLLSFVYDVRDFNIYNIDNEIIKNDNNSFNSVIELKNKTNELIKRYNVSYVERKIEGLPNHIRNSKLFVQGLGEVNFKEFFKDIIAPRLNNHKKIIINNKEFSLSDMIEYYKSQIKNDIKVEDIKR